MAIVKNGLLPTIILSLVGLFRSGQTAEPIEVFMRLIDEVETPAREAGVLLQVRVREGQMVEEGEVLAQVEDAEAQFNAKRAELELIIARKEAEDDVLVRAAEKAEEVAKNDWQRAERTVADVPNALSASEVEHRRLTAQKAALDVEAAKRDLAIACVRRDLKDNELAYAQQKLDRHKVTAALDGMVVQVYRHRGEWVEPGDKVARIIRLDLLRAEGFADATVAGPAWVGRPATVHLLTADGQQTFKGKVTFVSPEIDPVNGQVAVWAEIENHDLQLRPGLKATMQIDLP